MVSFDVKAVFTNEYSAYTIDLVQKRIYKNHEISTSIARNGIRNGIILLLCNKKLHFTLRGIVHLKADRVAMGSPSEPVLAGTFTVH